MYPHSKLRVFVKGVLAEEHVRPRLFNALIRDDLARVARLVKRTGAHSELDESRFDHWQ
jgi:hypothetical protein